MRPIIFLLLHLIVLSYPVPSRAIDGTVLGKDGAEMVPVAEGEFVMGLKDDEHGSEKNPLRKMGLKAFYIDKYEVTNARYKQCVAAGACKKPSLIIDYPGTIHEDGKAWYDDPGKNDYPVVGLTWLQAVTYCSWAGKRLPNAAEWEKAARGTDGRTYPWGNVWETRRANWDDGGKTDGYRKSAPVGRFPEGASPYGAMDMAGNVREWVDNLILKGGSWYSGPGSLRAGDPGHEYIVERDDDMGFRCAMGPSGTADKEQAHPKRETLYFGDIPIHKRTEY
jgi:formylglycine-generating enzyme required for sulfatase activity